MKKIIVYGSKGWIGSQFCHILNDKKKNYISLDTRIDNYEAVENDIKCMIQLYYFFYWKNTR